MGFGFLESVYEKCMLIELRKGKLNGDAQKPIKVYYNHEIVGDFVADVIVNDTIILELKSVKNITAAHLKQIQTYLRLTGLKLGFLLNFGSALMKNGIKRAVNGLPE